MQPEAETTQPAPLGKARSFKQWLDELAADECGWEAVFRGVADSLSANPDAGWELLALVDQHYRRHKMRAKDFQGLNSTAHHQAPDRGQPRMLAVDAVLRSRYRIRGILGHGGMGTVYTTTAISGTAARLWKDISGASDRPADGIRNRKTRLFVPIVADPRREVSRTFMVTIPSSNQRKP